MRTARHRLLFAVLLFVVLTALISAHAQITPSQDAYTDSSKPTTNFGTATTLGTANTLPSIQASYIQFDLSSIPAGYTGANIAKATLKLYVNSAATAGSLNVDFVSGTWSEKTITHNLAPALGTTIVSGVPLTTASTNRYVEIDITSALQAWLNGTPNDGIALVANSPLSATFDSKENTAQSHPPELDVVFNGAITGINTAASSGLTGGGSSGTLNLSLLKTCSSGQILAWTGSTWACKTVAGTGTVTSVGSGLGLKGGPITTSGTLAIDPTVVPRLNVANTFTGNQTVNGNVSATGQLISMVAHGTAPLAVNSTTQVANLNASLLGGLPAGSFAKLWSNVFTGNQIIQSGVLAINTATPLSVSTLEADVNAPGALGPVLSLVNLGGNLNAAAAVDFKTYGEVGSPYNPGARIEAVDVGNFGDNIVFLLNNPGAPSNGLAEVLRLTPNGLGRTQAQGLQVTDSAGDGSDGLVSQAADGSSFGGDGVRANGGNVTVAGSSGGDGVFGKGGGTTVSGSRGGSGVVGQGGGGNGSSFLQSGGYGVRAFGGDNADPSGLGGFGIEATGGLNGDGTVARAGEFHGDVEIQGCLGVAGTPNIGTCTSDVRLKKNIQPFPAVLDKLVRLQPVSYNWRVDEYPQFRFGTSRASGLIAQEVEKVFPELVSVDAGGFRRVNYGELPYLTLQGIRELKARNDRLAARVKAGDAQIRKLSRQVQQLQTVQQRLAAIEGRLARVEVGDRRNPVSIRTQAVPPGLPGGGRRAR